MREITQKFPNHPPLPPKPRSSGPWRLTAGSGVSQDAALAKLGAAPERELSTTASSRRRAHLSGEARPTAGVDFPPLTCLAGRPRSQAGRRGLSRGRTMGRGGAGRGGLEPGYRRSEAPQHCSGRADALRAGTEAAREVVASVHRRRRRRRDPAGSRFVRVSLGFCLCVSASPQACGFTSLRPSRPCCWDRQPPNCPLSPPTAFPCHSPRSLALTGVDVFITPAGPSARADLTPTRKNLVTWGLFTSSTQDLEQARKKGQVNLGMQAESSYRVPFLDPIILLIKTREALPFQLLTV